MRETLFRGKRIDDDKWTYGYLFKCWDRCYLLWGMNGDNPIKEEVVPETVGEYAGLTDKNGKRIFEGDIVRFDYVNDEGNDAHEDFLIFFEEGAFRAQYLENPKVAPNTLHDDIAIDEGYVVGNRWDNRELLNEN